MKKIETREGTKLELKDTTSGLKVTTLGSKVTILRLQVARENF